MIVSILLNYASSKSQDENP